MCGLNSTMFFGCVVMEIGLLEFSACDGLAFGCSHWPAIGNNSSVHISGSSSARLRTECVGGNSTCCFIAASKHTELIHHNVPTVTVHLQWSMFSSTVIIIELQDRDSSTLFTLKELFDTVSTREFLVLLGMLDCTVLYKLSFYSLIFITSIYLLLSKCIVNN